jgi:AcrR family transcriptional regulator
MERRLFYSEGIHIVPVNCLVTEANVTRATFYRHFPAKEDLVEAHLRATDTDVRKTVTAALDRDTPKAAAAALLELIGQTTCTAGFRGGHFINASAECPDSTSGPEPGGAHRPASVPAARLSAWRYQKDSRSCCGRASTCPGAR